MPESTLAAAIEELHAIVEALKELMEREFPRRAELEQGFEEQRRKALETFVTKKVSRQRWLFILCLAPLMVVSTFFFTVGTVSSCFLGRNQTEPPAACSLIPGFDETRERQEEFARLIERLQRKVVEE